MPSFTKKDGSKGFHMNPQAAKAMSGSSGLPHKAEEQLEEKISPGIHQKVGEEYGKLKNYDGHEHNGHMLAHHVELHHGGHEQGEPPMHEGTTHHTIAHPHPAHGSEPEIRNHESSEDAHNEENDAMHEGCPECEQASADDGSGNDGVADLMGEGAE